MPCVARPGRPSRPPAAPASARPPARPRSRRSSTGSPGWSPIGTPNVFAVSAYSMAMPRSRSASADRVGRDQVAPSPIHSMASSKPWPISPRTLRCRHPHVVEDQRDRPGRAHGLDGLGAPAHRPVDEERRGAAAAMPESGSVTATTMDEVGVVAVGDERLLAVEYPVVAVAAGAELDVAASEPAPGSVIAKQEIRVALDRREQELVAVGSRWRCRGCCRPRRRTRTARRCGRSRSRSATQGTAGSSTPPYCSGVRQPQKPNFLALSCSSRSSLSARGPARRGARGAAPPARAA